MRKLLLTLALLGAQSAHAQLIANPGVLPSNTLVGGNCVQATGSNTVDTLPGAPCLTTAAAAAMYLPLTGGTLTGPLSTQGITVHMDGANVLMTPLNPANTNQWRMLSTIAGLNPGNLRLQSSTDAFSSIGSTVEIDPLGSISTTGSLATAGDINATGNVNVKGTLSSTTNIQPAGPTNSGVAMGGGPNYAITSFYDQSRSVNNRTAQEIFISGQQQLRFVNDAGSTAVPWLVATGGVASGITGIASSSGSGTWAHTGAFSATSNITGFNVVANGGSLYAGGAPSTPLNVTTLSSVQAFIGGAANQATVAYINSSNTADNRSAYSQWAGSTFAIAAFANDAFNAGRPIITASGGYASGITGIASNSGSGEWTHTGTLNATTGLKVNGVPLLPALSGTTGSIGGAALLLGTCATGTAAVTGATTSMAVAASPVTYPGAGMPWNAYVSAPGVVTVQICAIIAGTPAATTYNVRVIQ